jgi:hypothetical protein
MKSCVTRYLPAFLFLFLLVLPFTAHAVTIDDDGTIHYDVKRERFYVPPDDEMDTQAASSVVIREISFNKLPDALQEDMKTLLTECVPGSMDETLPKLRLYSYVSDRQRDRDLPASYFLDTRGVFAVGQKTCAIGDVCTKDGCHMLGFNAEGEDNWNVQKSVRIMNWGVAQAKPPKNEPMVTYFQLMTKEACDDPNASATGCVQNYIWAPSGFIRYDLPSLAKSSEVIKGKKVDMPKAKPADDDVAAPDKDDGDSDE